MSAFVQGSLCFFFLRHKLQFLCDIFGVFDVLVVIATSVDIYILQPFDAGYAQNFAVGRLTRIFRLMRIFRCQL